MYPLCFNNVSTNWNNYVLQPVRIRDEEGCYPDVLGTSNILVKEGHMLEGLLDCYSSHRPTFV